MSDMSTHKQRVSSLVISGLDTGMSFVERQPSSFS